MGSEAVLMLDLEAMERDRIQQEISRMDAHRFGSNAEAEAATVSSGGDNSAGAPWNYEDGAQSGVEEEEIESEEDLGADPETFVDDVVEYGTVALQVAMQKVLSRLTDSPPQFQREESKLNLSLHVVYSFVSGSDAFWHAPRKGFLPLCASAKF